MQTLIGPTVRILIREFSGDMKRIHQKSQNIENRKIQFFQEILTEYVSIVDYAKMGNLFKTIR